MPDPEPVVLPELLNVAAHFLDARIDEGLGDRIAIRTDDRTWTYREVQSLADGVAEGLRTRDLGAEDRIVLAMPDGIGFVAAFFAILKIGGVVVMVNPDQAAEEIAATTAYVRPRAILVDPDHAEIFAAHGTLARADGLYTVSNDATHLDGEALPTEAPVATAITHRDEPAIWLFSGGTTGRPKAVIQSHGAFANTTELYAVRTLGYRADDITLSIPKLYFGYATGSNLLFPFAVGASAVLFDGPPIAETLFDKIRRHRPTILINVPTVVGRMLSSAEASDADLSCLRFATSAGEALPVSLYERWKDTFGVELLDGLGTAEMWHVFVTNTVEATRPGTLGKVVPGFELRICGADGEPLPDGEVGRLWVRGRSRALGYWQALDKTCEAFHGEWFVGGDLVSRDADGYVTFAGRGDDALKVGGRWLLPGEVESCLLRHPAVAECAVVGGTDVDGLTKPFAFVRPHEPVSDRQAALGDALKQHVLEHLQPYKHPRRVLFVDTMPRTHLGKVDRTALRKTLG